MDELNEQKDIVQEFWEDLTSSKFGAFLFICFNIWIVWYTTEISVFPENIEKNTLYVALMSFATYNLTLSIVFIFFDKSVKVSFRIIRANFIFLFGFIFLVVQRDFIFSDIWHEAKQQEEITELKKQVSHLEAVILDNLAQK